MILRYNQECRRMAAGMQAKGMAPNTALQTAYKMLDGSVTVQATVLSYMDIFLYVGINVSCVCSDSVDIYKKIKSKMSMADAAH